MVAAVLVGISNGGIEVEDIQVATANDTVLVIKAVKSKIGHALRAFPLGSSGSTEVSLGRQRPENSCCQR